MHVMIADDSTLVRRRLVRWLSDMPNIRRISEAATGEEALSMIKQDCPDLLLLDIRMPYGSGIYVLEMLKKNRTDVKTVVITNYSTEWYQDAAEAFGVASVIDKANLLPGLEQFLMAMGQSHYSNGYGK